jgi:hypothetical protein
MEKEDRNFTNKRLSVIMRQPQFLSPHTISHRTKNQNVPEQTPYCMNPLFESVIADRCTAGRTIKRPIRLIAKQCEVVPLPISEAFTNIFPDDIALLCAWQAKGQVPILVVW